MFSITHESGASEYFKKPRRQSIIFISESGFQNETVSGIRILICFVPRPAGLQSRKTPRKLHSSRSRADILVIWYLELLPAKFQAAILPLLSRRRSSAAIKKKKLASSFSSRARGDFQKIKKNTCGSRKGRIWTRPCRGLPEHPFLCRIFINFGGLRAARFCKLFLLLLTL